MQKPEFNLNDYVFVGNVTDPGIQRGLTDIEIGICINVFHVQKKGWILDQPHATDQHTSEDLINQGQKGLYRPKYWWEKIIDWWASFDRE